MEDSEIVADLRHLNSGNKTKYDVFWDECGKFLKQNIGTAVDDRRHIGITHIATAISVRNLRDQVARLVQKAHQYLLLNGSDCSSG